MSHATAALGRADDVDYLVGNPGRFVESRTGSNPRRISLERWCLMQLPEQYPRRANAAKVSPRARIQPCRTRQPGHRVGVNPDGERCRGSGRRRGEHGPDVGSLFSATLPRTIVSGSFATEMNTGPVRGWWRCVGGGPGHVRHVPLVGRFADADLPRTDRPFLSDERVAFAFTAAEIGSAPGAGRMSYAHAAGLMPSKKFITGSLASRGRYPLSPACALFDSVTFAAISSLNFPPTPALI